MVTSKTAAGALLWVLLAACGGGNEVNATPSAAPLISRVESQVQDAEPGQRLAQIREVMRAKAMVPGTTTVRLGALDRGKSDDRDGPLKIGVARAVDVVARPADLAAVLRWQTDASGRSSAAIGFESTAAEAVRLGVQVGLLPPLSVLRVRAASGQAVEVDSVEVLRTIQRNLEAGVPDEEARLYWLPTVSGAQVALEIELAAGIDPATLRLAVPRLAHLWATPETADMRKIGEAASCHVDVMCTDGHAGESAAVARMLFIRGDAAYVCSGALMNDTRNSHTPYFLSAYHCISTQPEASTLETYWFYRAASCQSSALNAGMTTLRGGATLLYASALTDTAFMRLNDEAPSGAVFAGWDAGTPDGSGVVKGLHHPRGDLQKVSMGEVAGFATCDDAAADGSVVCRAANQHSGTRLIALWNSGTTEQGSSGSPLFSTINGSSYVVGQLHSGAGACEAERFGLYGRFDLAFSAALKNWLAPTDSPAPGVRSPVYRFYNAGTNAHFYTNNELEKDWVIQSNPAFAYEGILFYAPKAPAVGASPVFRFYNTRTGVHFYTINAAERDWVVSTMPEFHYEGPVWHAQIGSGGTATPMYRFYSSQRGAHFYTLSASEAVYVRQYLKDFADEGIAYYAWTQP